MHIVSASRRTDIPAFYSRWFMNRIRAGGVKAVSPFGGRVFEVSLAREEVIAIVFWTKNAAPILADLEDLASLGYSFSFLYTINNYPDFVEPYVPSMRHTMKTVEALARRFSPGVFRWRYDTIILTDTLGSAWHLRNFEGLCRLLSLYTDECIFSFCDYYKKTIRNMDRLVPTHQIPSEAQCGQIAGEMSEVAARWGITLASCAHDFLVSGSITKARCIDPDFLSQVVNSPEKAGALRALKAAPSRKQCGCVASRDIGAYDTCLHGCVYCYANTDRERAVVNQAKISEDSDCLDPRGAMAGR